MKPERSSIEQSLYTNFAAGLTDALASMLGMPPMIAWEKLSDVPPEVGFLWRQPFPPLTGELLIAGSPADVTAIGQIVMAELGVENAAPEEVSSTFHEALGQTLSTVARSLTMRLGQEISPTGGADVPEAEPIKVEEASWAAIKITIGETVRALSVGVKSELTSAILGAYPEEAAKPKQMVPSTPFPASEQAPQQLAMAQTAGRTTTPPPPPAGNTAEESRRIELLMDVELPVSVSFGKAHVPLKEVLKLTSGSIVELGRGVGEPVDVVVNNCVIARGEVVVVEGNFGIRILRVVSRGERLETIR